MIMRRYIGFFIAALCFGAAVAGCSELTESEEMPGGSVDPSVVGEWRLDVMNGSIVDGFGVYVKFGADGRFELFQQLSTSYYEPLSGVYSAVNGVLSGYYSDGVPMNEYDYAAGADGNTLILTSRGEENPVKSIYVRTEIPADLIPEPISRSERTTQTNVVRAL